MFIRERCVGAEEKEIKLSRTSWFELDKKNATRGENAKKDQPSDSRSFASLFFLRLHRLL
jgi:hypothetical protein